VRRCTCGKIWEDDHVTICLICGAGTRQYEPPKKEKVKDGNRSFDRDSVTRSS